MNNHCCHVLSFSLDLCSLSDAESELSVEVFFAEIDQVDIDNIEIRPDTLKYFETIAAYLKCHDELEASYHEMDPTHKLANLSRGYDMNTFYPTAFHER